MKKIHIVVEFRTNANQSMRKIEALFDSDEWTKLDKGRWMVDHNVPLQKSFHKEGFIEEIRRNAHKQAEKLNLKDYEFDVQIHDECPIHDME